MSAQQPTPIKPKKRGPRRNYQQELRDIRAFCQIKVEVLHSIDTTGNDPFWKSSIEAYEDVLKRIGDK